VVVGLDHGCLGCVSGVWWWGGLVAWWVCFVLVSLFCEWLGLCGGDFEV